MNEEKGFTCPKCGMTSFNPHDREYGYCGKCHEFTGDPERLMEENLKKKYLDLAHAMQSGVAAMMNYDPAETSPKHLRTGINSALVNSSAIAHLLIKKGVITESEYFEALVQAMAEEVERYREALKEHLGIKPILG